MGELSNHLKEKKLPRNKLAKVHCWKVKQNKIRYQIGFSSLSPESTMKDQALFFFHLVNKIPAGKAKRKPDLRLPSSTFKIIVLMPICIIIMFLIYFPCST